VAWTRNPCEVSQALNRLPRRARARPGKHPQGLESGRIACVGSQFEQAVHENRAEQFRRAPGGIENLPGRPLLVLSERPGPRLSPVDTIESLNEIADHMTFACQKLVTPIPAPVIAPGPLLSGLPGRRLPGLVLGGTLPHDGRQAGQFSCKLTVRASDAVSLIEIDSKFQGLLSLGQGGGACSQRTSTGPIGRPTIEPTQLFPWTASSRA